MALPAAVEDAPDLALAAAALDDGDLLEVDDEELPDEEYLRLALPAAAEDAPEA